MRLFIYRNELGRHVFITDDDRVEEGRELAVESPIGSAPGVIEVHCRLDLNEGLEKLFQLARNLDDALEADIDSFQFLFDRLVLIGYELGLKVGSKIDR